MFCSFSHTGRITRKTSVKLSNPPASPGMVGKFTRFFTQAVITRHHSGPDVDSLDGCHFSGRVEGLAKVFITYTLAPFFR